MNSNWAVCILLLLGYVMQAFAELQQKSYETYQKIDFADRQVDGLKRTILHKQITDKELQVSLNRDMMGMG